MKRYIKSTGDSKTKITDYVDRDTLDEVFIGVFGDDYEGFIPAASMIAVILRPTGNQKYKFVRNESYNWDCYLIENPNKYFIFNDIGEILQINLDD